MDTLATRQKIESGISDTRSLLEILNPPLPHYGLDDENIEALITILNVATGWKALTGNTKRDRWYYPDLQENEKLHNTVATALTW